MKLNIILKLETPFLPRDYRSGFISIIKSAFEQGDEMFYRKLYNNKTDKPFTFSVYFPELRSEENNNLRVGNKAILNFSSNDPVLITHLYNGIRKLKVHKWKDENTFTIQNIRAFFNKEIKKDSCTFKTVAPFLVNRKGDNLKYLTPEDEDFDHSFRFNINELCHKFLNINEIDFDYKIIKHKKMVVSHYNQSMTCNKAIIEMKARPEILNLLYNIGIGVRRSQGFGMIDLI